MDCEVIGGPLDGQVRPAIETGLSQSFVYRDPHDATQYHVYRLRDGQWRYVKRIQYYQIDRKVDE